MTDYIHLADKLIERHPILPRCDKHDIYIFDGVCQLCLMHERRIVQEEK